MRATQSCAEVLRRSNVGMRATASSAEVLRTNGLGMRSTACSAEVLRLSTEGMRATACSAEVLQTNNRGMRSTACSAEVLVTGIGAMRATACSAEVLQTIGKGMFATACSVEVLRTSNEGMRATACSAEVLRASNVGMLATACSAEILRAVSEGMRATSCSAEVLISGIWPARITQVVAEVMRLWEGRAFVTQSVGEVLRTIGTGEEEEPEVVTLRVWPFEANAAYDLQESYGYLGRILRSRKGVEQRIQLRATPSGEVSFTCTILTTRELQLATVLLGTLIGQPIGVPLWQYKTALASNVTAYDTSIATDTATVPWYSAGLGLLWQSPWDYEIFEVQAVESGSLTLTSGVAHSWAARETFILPLVIGYLQEREELQRHTLRAGSYEFKFDVPAYFA